MDYETGKILEEHEKSLQYIIKVLQEKGIIPQEAEDEPAN